MLVLMLAREREKECGSIDPSSHVKQTKMWLRGASVVQEKERKRKGGSLALNRRLLLLHRYRWQQWQWQ